MVLDVSILCFIFYFEQACLTMWFKISYTNRGKKSFTRDGYLYRGGAQTSSAKVV